MQVNVQFNANLPIQFEKKAKWFVASCSILDVHSQGETKEQAKANLEEALTLFFLSCFERGTLDAVLKSCGFKGVHTPDKPDQKPLVSREDYINVPIPFLVDQDNATCHA
jgi:predicted RNase H-like HicB family nuclease